MCNAFYHWSLDDETGFRKLILQQTITEFKKEKDKFANYNGEYKKCTKCLKFLPKNDYFFKVASRERDGLSFNCKECLGYKFAWGKTKKYELIAKGYKYCQSCDTILPLNDLYFSRLKSSKADGYASYCKKCKNSESYGINSRLNNNIDLKNGHKICTLCFVELPSNKKYYFKSTSSIDGLESVCKKCQGVEFGIVYLNKVHKDVIPKGMKYCYACKRLLNYNYFSNLKDSNDGKSSICLECGKIHSHKRREDMLNNNYTNIDWQIAKSFWSDANGNVHCAYCNEVTENPTMEHVIPFSKGGKFTPNNIIPVCKTCNSSKNNKELDEYYNYSDKFTFELYNKIITYINSFDLEVY